MAMGVYQTGHQQLAAIAKDARPGIFGRNGSERSILPDRAVRDRNCPSRDHTGPSEARIGYCIRTPHDNGLSHGLALLQLRARGRGRTSIISAIRAEDGVRIPR